MTPDFIAQLAAFTAGLVVGIVLAMAIRRRHHI